MEIRTWKEERGPFGYAILVLAMAGINALVWSKSFAEWFGKGSQEDPAMIGPEALPAVLRVVATVGGTAVVYQIIRQYAHARLDANANLKRESDLLALSRTKVSNLETEIVRLGDTITRLSTDRSEEADRKAEVAKTKRAVGRACEDLLELKYRIRMCVRRFPKSADPEAIYKWEWKAFDSIGQNVDPAISLLRATGEWTRATLTAPARQMMEENQGHSTLLDSHGPRIMEWPKRRYKTAEVDCDISPAIAFRLGQIETNIGKMLETWHPDMVKGDARALADFLPILQPWKPPAEAQSNVEDNLQIREEASADLRLKIAAISCAPSISKAREILDSLIAWGWRLASDNGSYDNRDTAIWYWATATDVALMSVINERHMADHLDTIKNHSATDENHLKVRMDLLRELHDGIEDRHLNPSPNYGETKEMISGLIKCGDRIFSTTPPERDAAAPPGSKAQPNAPIASGDPPAPAAS